MRTRFLLPLIIAIILTLTLTSCVGIGDGALIGNVQTSGDENAADDCVLTVYDADGNGRSRVRFGKEDMQELLSLISTGEYPDKPRSCIRVCKNTRNAW